MAQFQFQPMFPKAALASEPSEETKRTFVLIQNLCDVDQRYNSMRELCIRSRCQPDLGMLLWDAVGAVAALVQEITNAYDNVMSKELDFLESNRVCYAVTLFQFIAAHAESRMPFLRSEIMMFLLPMLNATVQTLPVEYVRLSVLGVIGDLVKTHSNEVVTFLLGPADVLPRILHFLELGSALSKAISSFILRRFLEHDVGLQYIGNNKSACLKMVYTLGKVVHQLTLEPEPRILKSIVITYKHLTNDKYAHLLLQNGHLPEQLRNDFFCNQYLVGYEELLQEINDLNRELKRSAEHEQGMTWSCGA